MSDFNEFVDFLNFCPGFPAFGNSEWFKLMEYFGLQSGSIPEMNTSLLEFLKNTNLKEFIKEREKQGKDFQCHL